MSEEILFLIIYHFPALDNTLLDTRPVFQIKT